MQVVLFQWRKSGVHAIHTWPVKFRSVSVDRPPTLALWCLAAKRVEADKNELDQCEKRKTVNWIGSSDVVTVGQKVLVVPSGINLARLKITACGPPPHDLFVQNEICALQRKFTDREVNR